MYYYRADYQLKVRNTVSVIARSVKMSANVPSKEHLFAVKVLIFCAAIARYVCLLLVVYLSVHGIVEL